MVCHFLTLEQCSPDRIESELLFEECTGIVDSEAISFYPTGVAREQDLCIFVVGGWLHGGNYLFLIAMHQFIVL